MSLMDESIVDATAENMGISEEKPDIQEIEQKEIFDTRIVPIFETFEDEKKTKKVFVNITQCPPFPTYPTKSRKTVGTLWNQNYWFMLNSQFVIDFVNYQVYWQEQNYVWDEQKLIEEEQRIQEEMEEEDTEPKDVRYEDQVLTDRAQELYDEIMTDRRKIVFAKPSDDEFEEDLMRRRKRVYFGDEPDFFETEKKGLVYEQAWEATKIMDHLVETNAQPKSLFGNYKEINEKLQQTYGNECARLLYELALFLSKHIHRIEEEPEEESVIEATEGSGDIPDA